MNKEGLLKYFDSIFGQEPVIVRSPGRVNLMGEHTDYNKGFVLPAAIDKAIYMAASKREDDELHFVSSDLKETYRGSLHDLKPSSMHWPDYILGVIQQLKNNGHTIGGMNCVFGGDIPIGAGMSSSAALECATLFALNEIYGLGLDRLSIAKMAQKAENDFVGVQCGIMDQFANMFGRAEHLIRLDCRSLSYEYIPFDFKNTTILLLDTGVKHSLASSEYNTRRKQCEAGVQLVKRHHPEVQSLRDVTMEMLDEHVLASDKIIYQRCKYIVEENRRLLNACKDLQSGNVHAFGKKMFETHEGLSKLYEVSCEELDFLVTQVKKHPGVLGSRMMGGGFGGCTINLVKDNAVDALVKEVGTAYQRSMNKELKAYLTKIENGTALTSLGVEAMTLK